MRRPHIVLVSMILATSMLLTMAIPAIAADKAVMKVIAKGAPIHGANGLYFDDNDNLYIASYFGREILVMNPLNGKIINRLGPDPEEDLEGVHGGDDLTFGPDGSLYWTDLTHGLVCRMTPNGEITKQLVAPGVNPITFSDDGRLFVALDFMGDGLYELDPNLVDPPTPLIVANASIPFPLGFLNGFDFGPDGRLYGPLFALGLVVSINVDDITAPTSDPWGDGYINIVATGFEVPSAAKFNSKEQLHVLDSHTGQVLQVNTSNGNKKVIAKLSPGIDNLAFDSQDNLYVSNANDGSVTRVLPNGQGRTLSPGGMMIPGGIAALSGPDGKDHLYVGDILTLREYDGLTGKDMGFTSGSLVGESGSLAGAMSVSTDDGNLVISTYLTGKIQVWNPATKQVLEEYSRPAEFPVNAIRFQDDLVVALPYNGVVWASSGYILEFPDVISPTGLAVIDESLLIVDRDSGILWRVDFDGKTPTSTTLIASGLSAPEGIALDIDGSLLIVEAGAGRLSRINLDTGNVSIVAEDLKLGAPGMLSWQFNDVTVGPSGAIYITGDIDNVIYRIWPRK